MPDNLASRTRYVGLLLFQLTAAFMLARTGRDALYFQREGIQQLPLAYGGIALAAVPMAAVLLSGVRHFGAARTRVTAFAGLALMLAVASVTAAPGATPAMTAFFIVVPVVFGGLFALAWLMAGEIIGRAGGDLGTAYSRAGAASILGGLAGSLLARMLSPAVPPQALLLLAAVATLGAAATARSAHRRFQRRATPRLRGPLLAASSAVVALAQPYVRLLMAIAAVAASAGVLIEFQFYLHVSRLAPDASGPSARFAELYVGLNLAALTLQVAVGPRLQRVVGVTGALVLLPAAIGGLLPAVIGVATGALISLLRLTEGGMKASLYRVSWEQVYLALGEGCRTEAKLLVDGLGVRLSEGAAAVVLHAGMGAPERLAAWLPWGLLALVALWIVLVARLRPVVAAFAHGPVGPDALTRMPDG